eukprot:2993309-Amphidinium_carterae.1
MGDTTPCPIKWQKLTSSVAFQLALWCGTGSSATMNKCSQQNRHTAHPNHTTWSGLWNKDNIMLI